MQVKQEATFVLRHTTTKLIHIARIFVSEVMFSSRRGPSYGWWFGLSTANPSARAAVFKLSLAETSVKAVVPERKAFVVCRQCGGKLHRIVTA